MQVICPISGLPIYKAPYLLGMELSDVHPIFRAKHKLILNADMVHRFMRATAFEEKKLIFLAVLNATDLVQFTVPAMPSLSVIESNFHKLMTTACWLSHAEYTYKQVVSWPQFVVSNDTKDLASIGTWRNELEAIKDQVIRKDIDRIRAAELSNKEAEIKRELGQAAFLGRSFTPMLARWALDFAELNRDDDRYNRYVKILCTPLKEAFVYELEELRDIETLLENELPSDHPQVLSVMHQVRELIRENKKGFADFAIFNDDDDDGATFTIIDESTGNITIRKSAHLIDIPDSKPIQSSYPSKIAFLMAKAKWDLSQRKNDSTEIGENDV